MSNIKVGDLVMIVRPMPCGHGKPGLPFKVGKIHLNLNGYIRCAVCNESHEAAVAYIPEGLTPQQRAIASYRVIKIDPPALPETIRTHDEVPA